MISILKQNQPEMAEFLEKWQAKFERQFDFSTQVGKADFYEGINELAKMIVNTHNSSDIKVVLGENGITGVKLQVSPSTIKKPSKDDLEELGGEG